MGRGASGPVEALSLIIWGSARCCNPPHVQPTACSAALPVGLGLRTRVKVVLWQLSLL